MTTGWAVPGFTDIRKVCDDPVGRRVVARHRMSRRLVFVTYLSQEFLADVEFRYRFRAESAQLTRVHDARVARLHRYVERDAGAAVVADHVPGTSLRDLLLDEGALGTDAALVVLKDVLRALAAGQAAGVAHGDLKPEGTILTPAGRARLVDFGLYTGPGRRLLGRSSPFYLAPELWADGVATAAADLYTATVLFFECLVGAPPFHAADAAALRALHREGTPQFDAIPGPLGDLVRTGLAKDPEARPALLPFLVQIEHAAFDTRGAGWERRGRRELTRLLTVPGHPPPLPAGPVARLGWERRQPVRLAAALGGAMALAAGLSSPVLPNGLFRMQTDSPGSGDRPPVMAFPGPADNAQVQANALRGATASETEQARPVLLTDPGSAVPAVATSPSPTGRGVAPGQAVGGIDVQPADDLAPIPAQRAARHDTSQSRSASYRTPSPRSAQHDAACEAPAQDRSRADSEYDRPRHAASDSRQQRREQSGSDQPTRTEQDQKIEKAEQAEQAERAQTYAQKPERSARHTQAPSDRAPRHQRRDAAPEAQTYSTYRSTPSQRSSSPQEPAPSRYSSSPQKASPQKKASSPQNSSPQKASVPQQQSPEQLSARQSAVEKMAKSGRTAGSASPYRSDAAKGNGTADTKRSATAESGGARDDYSTKSSDTRNSDAGNGDTGKSTDNSTAKSTSKSTGKSTVKHGSDTGSGGGNHHSGKSDNPTDDDESASDGR